MSKRSFSRFLYSGMVIVLGVVLAATLGGVHAAQTKGGTLHVGSADIGGVVTSPKGPEAGVWVIAETTELPTKLVKIVVTDDSTAREAGFHDTPAFRIGRTGGKMKDFSGSNVEEPRKYIVRTRPSGERYIAGISAELQHPAASKRG